MSDRRCDAPFSGVGQRRPYLAGLEWRRAFGALASAPKTKLTVIYDSEQINFKREALVEGISVTRIDFQTTTP